MKKYLTGLLAAFCIGCSTPTFPVDAVEEHADGLYYLKEENKLADGRGIKKWENGQIAEEHLYEDGLPVGGWNAYNEDGEKISYGEAFKIKGSDLGLSSVELTNSFLTINNNDEYRFGVLKMHPQKNMDDTATILKVAKAVFDRYAAKYKFADLVIHDRTREVLLQNYPNLERSRFDTIKGVKKLRMQVVPIQPTQ